MSKVQTTKVFRQFMDSKKRINVFQGGTRSGKTYNIVLAWIYKLSQENNKVLTVCRQTLPSLKNSVYRDFIEILFKMNIYEEKNLSKSEMTYKLGTNLIEFRNLDDDQKIRGAKRDYLYINEANEVSYPIWKQLTFRTKEKIVLDFNPSDEFHWIYDDVITRPDCDFFQSTYLDNPFLPIEQVKEIERLREIDPNYWRIYGLGERGMSEATIFKNWELTDEEKPQGYECYGLDFGFNDPNALVEVVLVDCEEPYIWVNELVYEPKLTTPDLVEIMKEKDLKGSKLIYGDNSRPETIQEIYNQGFNIKPCLKGKGSIKAGIDWIKRYKVKITKQSTNILKEIKSYKWKVDKDERVLDEPVDLNNHSIDAIRYALTEKAGAEASFETDTFSDLMF